MPLFVLSAKRHKSKAFALSKCKYQKLDIHSTHTGSTTTFYNVSASRKLGLFSITSAINRYRSIW